MKCPKCNQEIDENANFCTKCGANIKEELEKKYEEEKRKQQEIEEKKHLEELKKQEALRLEEELKEAEKEQAIKQAKEEGIELEIIDQKSEKKEQVSSEEANAFKVTKQGDIKQKEKKHKVKIKKNIFQIIFEKLLFIIVVSVIVIIGIYYCYKQQILPDFFQKDVEDFDNKLQNVIKMNKEIDK